MSRGPDPNLRPKPFEHVGEAVREDEHVRTRRRVEALSVPGGYLVRVRDAIQHAEYVPSGAMYVASNVYGTATSSEALMFLEVPTLDAVRSAFFDDLSGPRPVRDSGR